LDQILEADFATVHQALSPQTEEESFILAMEWDALRAAIAHYTGRDDEHFDAERCRMSSIDCQERSIAITEVILPPKALPKILPCSLNAESLN
jgi:hypothetical protein